MRSAGLQSMRESDTREMFLKPLDEIDLQLWLQRRIRISAMRFRIFVRN